MVRLQTIRTALFCLSWLALGVMSSAQASTPQLNIVQPRGVQRGTEAELTLSGARLDGAEQAFLYRTGVEVLAVEQIDANNVKVKVRVAADCPLGEQLIQLRTRSGVSEFRSFFVGALPAVAEVEPNGSLEEAGVTPLNSTVTGIVENEDVDYFKVTLAQGQRLSVEVEALRLGTTLFDPFISILDSRRFELAAVDDSPLVLQDGVLSVVAPEAGDYFVAIRESSYGGNGGFQYRLHIGNFPRPTAVYPAGGKYGETMDVRFIGDALGDRVQSVQVPSVDQYGFSVFAQDEMGIAPSGIPFRTTEFGNTLEQEPNNEFAAATAADLTTAFNGIIETPGDIDMFRFTAQQGQVFELECYARRIRSGLDPVINVYKADGSGIGGNDDSRGPDSYLRFQAPETGDYIVRVTDHLSRGQADFVYRLEFQPIKPTLSLNIPRIDRYSQTRQTLVVARGNRFGVLINANRNNFGGQLVLTNTELYPGVTVHALPMNENLTLMPLVIEAAADAPVGGQLVDLEMRHIDEATAIRGRFENNADFVLGPPNNAVYLNGHIEKVAIAVVDELPYSIEIVQPQSPIVLDGTKELRIRVTRAEGYAQPVTVEFPFRSPGIGAPSSITIPADQTEGVYLLNAAGNAAVGDWPMYAVGQADVGGPAYVSSQLATLTVAAPFVTAEVPRASCEQGQTVPVLATVTLAEGFAGTAKAEIIGLPPNATADPVEITAGMTEVTFNIKTAADTPVGKHKSPFLQITYMVNNEPVTSVTGRFELQVDAPLPMPTAPAEPMPQAPMPEAAPAEAPAKPLSRLERLRQEAQQGGGN